MSVISMKQLLEAGVQFGHPTRQWNPKMGKYIFAARNDTHIIDLEQTVVLADVAYEFVRESVSQGKTVLFVGTKKQAIEAIEQEAIRAGMFYVNSRWLGGTLTNFKTIQSRIDRMNKLNHMERTGEFELFTKKEVIKLKAERDKLQKNLGGIKDMHNLPGLLFVVDLRKEHIAIKEARLLNIPVVALVDTNCDPELADYVIPGNDDAIRSVKLVAAAMADACIEGKGGVIEREVESDSVANEAKSVEKAVTKAKEETTAPVVKSAVKAEAKPVEKASAEVKTEAKATKTEVKKEIEKKPEVKAVTKATAETKAKAEVKKPVVKAEAKTAEKAVVKPVSKATKTEVKADAKPKAKSIADAAKKVKKE